MIDHVSYNSFKTFAQCPYSFRLSYVDNLKPDISNIHTTFGKAIHTVCENKLLGKIKTKEQDDFFEVSFLTELKTLTKDYLRENKDFIKQMRREGKIILSNFDEGMKKYFGEYEVVGTEILLMTDIPETSIKWKGFIDAILKIDNKYQIIDFKTCSWGWDIRHKNAKLVTYQLTFYKKFYSQSRSIVLEDIDTHFVLLKRVAKKKIVEPFKVSSGQKKIDNAMSMLNTMIFNVERGFYPKKKTSACEYCPHYHTKNCK